MIGLLGCGRQGQMSHDVAYSRRKSWRARGPFKPDFGLSGILRLQNRVFPPLARAGVRSIRNRFLLVPRRPLRDEESCSTAILRGARTIPFSPGSNECNAVSLQTAHDCER